MQAFCSGIFEGLQEITIFQIRLPRYFAKLIAEGPWKDLKKLELSKKDDWTFKDLEILYFRFTDCQFTIK